MEKMNLDEMAEMLKNLATSDNTKNNTNQILLNSQPQLQRKFSGGSRGSVEKLSIESSNTSINNNPFETINQERLKPSRVEAIQHMFEKSGASNNSGNTTFFFFLNIVL